MRKVDYRLQKESWKSQKAAGRYNPGLEITFRDATGKHTHPISAGSYDDIYVYREKKETFVLSKNDRLGYMGIEVFEGEYNNGDIFIQSPEQVAEIVGKATAPHVIIKRLVEYLR